MNTHTVSGFTFTEAYVTDATGNNIPIVNPDDAGFYEHFYVVTLGTFCHFGVYMDRKEADAIDQVIEYCADHGMPGLAIPADDPDLLADMDEMSQDIFDETYYTTDGSLWTLAQEMGIVRIK